MNDVWTDSDEGWMDGRVNMEFHMRLEHGPLVYIYANHTHSV